MKVIGIDSGKAGWIIFLDNDKVVKSIPMPTREILIKGARYVFKHKDPKILIKSGANKGQRAKVIKTPKKTATELHESRIYEILASYVNDECKIAIEAQSGRSGNSSKVSTTIDFNYGKMICILELIGADYKEISPATWKKHYSLDFSRKEKTEFISKYELAKDGKREFEKYKKQKSIEKAIELGLKNPKKHDEAEAFLIAKYFEEKHCDN